MILVTGATGTIGRHAVRQLAASGAELTAFARDRAKAAALGVPIAIGDFDAPATLGPALAGVTRVLLNGAVAPNMVAQQTAMIDAAKAAGVRHIVRVSGAGASSTSDRAIARWHAEIDAHLQASGIAWSILQPTFFMQNVAQWADGARSGALYGGFGAGKLAMIDCEDIAACAVALLAAPPPVPGTGRAYELTGREALSFSDVAAKLSARLGRPVAYVDRPPRELVAGMMSRGVPEPIAASFGAMMDAFAHGGASAITAWVVELIGRPPRTFDDYLDGDGKELWR